MPGIGVDQSHVRESTMVMPENVNIKYDRHVLKELLSYTSVALPRALTNGC